MPKRRKFTRNVGELTAVISALKPVLGNAWLNRVGVLYKPVYDSHGLIGNHVNIGVVLEIESMSEDILSLHPSAFEPLASRHCFAKGTKKLGHLERLLVTRLGHPADSPEPFLLKRYRTRADEKVWF